MGLFTGPDIGRIEWRLARIERSMAIIMEALGIEKPGPHPAAADIRDAISRGRKIEAIKLYRDAMGTGLAEAKDAIDRGTWAQDLGAD
ncbi:MAG: hypothetical protein EA378_07445 [Phycisphaerales bacterium]|nr:MAG: hypothetical protein EA378_07445 [Phycisphaerales bacterium]